MTGPLVTVHLLQLPVPLAARARQHFEELQREFTLMAATADDGAHEVPARLTALVASLQQRYAGVNDEATERLERAIARGDAVVEDHVLQVPPDAGPASRALGAVLDEADEFCRQGRHLLTLETPPDLVAYRRWYLGEVVDQLGGAAPRPWGPRPLRAV